MSHLRRQWFKLLSTSTVNYDDIILSPQKGQDFSIPWILEDIEPVFIITISSLFIVKYCCNLENSFLERNHTKWKIIWDQGALLVLESIWKCNSSMRSSPMHFVKKHSLKWAGSTTVKELSFLCRQRRWRSLASLSPTQWLKKLHPWSMRAYSSYFFLFCKLKTFQHHKDLFYLPPWAVKDSIPACLWFAQWSIQTTPLH